MKNMAGYDPFSGGGGFTSESKPEKTNDLSKKITKGIIIFVILAVIGFGIYYFFFNTAEVYFEIENTEGQSVDASIRIKKLNSSKEDIYSSDDVIKLNKNNKYTYRILPTSIDYNGIPTTEFTTEEETISITLTKKIYLKIDSFSCPQKIFLGQKVTCQINLENTTNTQEYTVNDLVFEGTVTTWDDFKNKTFKFVDQHGNEISDVRKTIQPQTNSILLISFNVPTDKKIIGNNKKIISRIKFTENKKEATFEIADSPEVSFSSEITKISKMFSGEEKVTSFIVDNSKNNSILSDLKLELDANYLSDFDYNLNITEAITITGPNISVDAKKRHPGTISIKLPNDTRAGKIEGNLILTGAVLPQEQKVNFTIVVEEPENKFNLNLSKRSENLLYDVNLQKTNLKTIDLQVDNQNNLKVKLNYITVENLLNNNCEQWITVPELYNNYEVQSKEKPKIPIILESKDLSLVTEIIGTKLCALKINYSNPFTGEEENKILDLTLNVS